MPERWLSCLVGERIATWLERLSKRKMLVGLVLGQLVSLLITSTGFSSSELARHGINAPTAQSLLNYVLLAIVYGLVLVIKRGPGLKLNWWYYLLLSMIDVEANYIIVKAYQYTSLTSVMLLDGWSIPCVILFTWVFLKTKYGVRKFIGVALCVAGLILGVFSDVYASNRAKGSNPLKGDMFVFAGATLYAVSNVGEEYLVKKGDRTEVMAMLGVFGAIISAIQISILERGELRSIEWNANAILPFIGFALAMFLFYSAVPTVLKISGATMLNLSLLTSDMWAVLIRIFAYHEKVDWIYFVAFAGVAIGLFIYSRSAEKDERAAQVAVVDTDEPKTGTDEESQVEYSDANSQREYSEPKDLKYDSSSSTAVTK